MLSVFSVGKALITTFLLGTTLNLADKVIKTNDKKVEFETSSTINYALSKLSNPIWLGIVGVSAYAIYKISWK